ncbi:MAG TPA: OmpH family outer membrane protein [Sphingomonadaceae bacterium]
MKLLLQPVAAAGLILMAAGPLAVAPAAAQELKTVGVVDLPYVLAQSSAYKTAEQQRPVTYKTQYDQAKTRSDQLKAQIQPMVDKLQADSKQPNANRSALQQQASAIQQLDQNGQNELNQILAPVALSQEYVQEQIQDKLGQAVENAAKAKGVSLILNRDNIVVYRAQSYDMNQAVIDELNKLLPTAQLVPPPGWLPREMREQQAAQQPAGAAPAAQQPAATAPAGPPVQGR